MWTVTKNNNRQIVFTNSEDFPEGYPLSYHATFLLPGQHFFSLHMYQDGDPLTACQLPLTGWDISWQDPAIVNDNAVTRASWKTHEHKFVSQLRHTPWQGDFAYNLEQYEQGQRVNSLFLHRPLMPLFISTMSEHGLAAYANIAQQQHASQPLDQALLRRR